MDVTHSVAYQLTAAATEFADQTDPQATIQAVANSTSDVIVGTASLTLCDDHELRLDRGAFSTERAEQADRFQFSLDSGPSLLALRNHLPVIVKDMSHERRWPQWTDQVAELGFGSMATVPLDLEPGRHGSLNVYWEDAKRPDGQVVATLLLLARHAAIAITNADHYFELRAALSARPAVVRTTRRWARPTAPRATL